MLTKSLLRERVQTYRPNAEASVAYWPQVQILRVAVPVPREALLEHAVEVYHEELYGKIRHHVEMLAVEVAADPGAALRRVRELLEELDR